MSSSSTPISSLVTQASTLIQSIPPTAIYVAVAAGGLLVLKSLMGSYNRRKIAARDSEPNMVYLYQYPIPPSWNGTTNSSPFCIKLETYLNYAKIPYKVVSTIDGHPQTGKLPYIRFNGQLIPDSSICIDFLNQHFGVDLDSHLSPSDRAISRGMTKLMEDSLYFQMLHFRWVRHPVEVGIAMIDLPPFVAKIIMPFLAAGAKKSVMAQGMGRLTDEQIDEIGRKDLDAVSAFLGDKPFMMGDEPSMVDCVALGALSSILWAPLDTPQIEYIRKTLLNIEPYLKRVQERMFPKWKEAIKHNQGGKEEKKKVQ